MKPYGSKKVTHYDTDPVIRAARAVEKRRGEELVEEQMAAEDDLWFTCRLCGKIMGDFWYLPVENHCLFCL